ncbi:MAG: SusC/RagA family TonB-linked outer membrane protein [Bacteroidota bacterium]
MEISTFCMPRSKYKRLKKIIMVIKLTTLIVFISCMQLSAAVFGQNINMSEKNVNLTTVLNKLEKQTGYTFFYKTSVIKKLPNVDVEIQNSTLEQVLNVAFAKSGITYTIIGKTIVINEQPGKPILANQLVLGRVVDAQGGPLPGVTIRLKGSNLVWVTNIKGEFTALLTTNDGVLQFSYIGYTTEEVSIKDIKGPLNISLRENVSKLDQVQVVAYGTTTKRLSTGDQTSLSAEDIAKYPTSNVLEALQGTVPGLIISKNTGNPNSTFKVQLRGINGLTSTGITKDGSRPPLYIVDGVPFESGSYTTQNGTLGNNTANGLLGQGGDALNFINPLDIESVTVLKDASATAIYGTRAADGVIVITTKKGKAGATKVDASFYSGYTSVSHLPDMLNLQQYLQMRKEAKRNDNTAIGATDYDINGVWDTTRSTNWAQKLLGSTGHVINAQTGISGGTNNIQYRVSTGYNRQTNLTALGGSNQNANLNFSINARSDNNKFSVQLNGGYFYNVNTIAQSDLTQNIVLAPDAPEIYNPDGTLNFQNNTFSNPYVAKNLLNHTAGTNLTSSAVISYRPITGLEFKTTLGYNRQQISEFLGSPSNAFAPSLNAAPSSTFTNDSNSWWSIEPQVNYTKDIFKGKLSVIVGSSLQKSVDESTQLRVTGYSSDLLLRSITAGTAITALAPYSYAPYKLNALFGRASYNWNNKYLLDISGRYDGSSHFGANHQFHLFSAVGAGWIFSEESLIKNNLHFLSFGKLRASYGVTGRDAIDAFRYLDTYTASTLAYQGVAGLLPSALPNPNLSWESTAKSEIGLELQFFQGRIAFETNFYRNRTSNVLNGIFLSQVTGFTSLAQNLPAVIQNQGYDVSLTGYAFRKKDFSWSTTLLYTRDRNTLISYPGLDKSAYANQYIIGQPVNINHAYSFAGVNTQTGLYQFNSKAGTIVSTPVAGTDNFALINVNPDFYGSVQNSFRYKQFTLDFLFRFIKQNGKNAFGQQGALPAGIAANTNFNTIVLRRWQKPGDVTDIQRYGTNINLLFSQSSAVQSDHAYGDASYIRFQNLSFAYTFPSSLQKKLHVQNLQLYVQGENLLTISRYGAIDPENQSAFALPPLRTITAGLRLSL